MRLLVISLLLLLLFILLTGVAVWVGHGQPPSLAVQQLHLFDCAPPCWIGIVPGETSSDEALRRFFETFALHESYVPISSTGTFDISSFQVVLGDEGDSVQVRFQFFRWVTSRIWIDLTRDGIPIGLFSVGNVLDMLGTPSCIDPKPQGYRGLSLIYENRTGLVFVGVPGESAVIQWTQPISFVSMREHPSLTRDGVCLGFHPWRGLRRSRYN